MRRPTTSSEDPLATAAACVNVLRHHYHLPAPEAAHRAVALRDRIMCRFLRLREQAMRAASPELRRYLTDMGNGIRGNAGWGQRVPRYVSLNDATTGPGEAAPNQIAWAEQPLDASAEPPPLPSIAWW